MVPRRFLGSRSGPPGCLLAAFCGWVGGVGPRFWGNKFASLNTSLFKGAFKEGFTGANFCTRIGIGLAVVDMAYSHSMAKKLSKELSKKLSKKHSKKQNFYTRIRPLARAQRAPILV